MQKSEQGILEGTITDVTERKAAEDKLHKSQHLTKKILGCTPNLIYIYDLQENCNVYSNKEELDFLGYSPEQIKSMGSKLFANILHPDDAEVVAKHHARFAKAPENATYDVEYRMKHSCGEWRWLRSRDTLFARTEQGLGKQILGICEDITERKKNEEENKKHATLIDLSPDAVVVKKMDDTITFWNTGAEKLYGYTKQEAIGQKIGFLLKGKRSKLFDNVINQLKQGKSWTGEITNYTKNNCKVIVQSCWSATLNAQGDIVEILESNVDITERKRAEEALKENEKRSRAIVANSPIGIATSGADKRFLSANEAFCRIIGYTEEELRKLTFKDITHSEDLKTSILKMRELENGTIPSFTLEKRYVGKDGALIDGKIMVNLVRSQNGEPNLFVAELEDITELKKTEERRKVLERKVNEYSKHLKWMVELRTAQLKDANERLVKTERLAAIGELAGMVGHDLRNPLTGIKNAAYFLKKKGATISEAQAKEMLEIIDKAIDHSNKIINDLLDYSREMHLELTKYEARTLLDETIGMIQVPDRIQIINHIQKETWIWVNSDKMMRVFLNLIKNAIDAMPDKGILEIRSHQTRDKVEIAFADTGSGITEETMRKLFTPLFTTKAQGMGFGLAICKRIVEVHGGTITVKTAVNKGTTFTISLPIKPKMPLFENQPVLEKQNAN